MSNEEQPLGSTVSEVMSLLPWLLSAGCPVARITSAAWHCQGQRTGCDLPMVTKLNGEQKKAPVRQTLVSYLADLLLM